MEGRSAAHICHRYLMTMTTEPTAKPTLTLNAASLTNDWETFLLDRIMNEAFWAAADDFVSDRFADMSDDEREKIQEFIQAKTQVIIKSPAFEWDKR